VQTTYPDEEPLEPYIHQDLEEEIIKYICEKVIVMREKPFINAVDNLRKT
jgi:hypothetical protein